MRRIFLPSIIAISLFAAATVLAQSVTITPKKTVYRRPKPTMDFKRTFTIRRPIAKAATPALSRRITTAISPEKVLDIDLKGELNEYQWLEEADYKVVYNRNGVLTVNLWMQGSGAYPDGVSKYVVVDIATGTRVTPADVFVNLQRLADVVKRIQKAEVDRSIAEMRKDPEAQDADPAQLFSDTNFTIDDLRELSVDAGGVTFHYNYGFPHVLEALEPAGEYRLTWARLKPFVKPASLLARFVN